MNLPSHLRIALGYLRKNKQYTILNVFGLSVGLACFTMIGLWVNDELSYDAFHTKADRTYRVASALADETASTQQAVTGSAVGPAMLRDFPEVAEAVRIDPSDATVRVNNETFVEDNILITEPAFFSVFDFQLIEGNSRTALSEPYSIVLSESTAKRYFPDSDPFGKSVRIFRFDPDGNGVDFKVTGIIKDSPHNSHVKYNMLISLTTWESFRPISAADGWYNNIFYTYVVLNKGASITSLEGKLPLLVSKYMTDEIKGKSNHSFFLQRMTDVHLSSSLMFDYGAGGSMTHVIIFGSVGIIVLLLAGMNYVNLATAHATARRKEVGVQKIMGARKRQLIMQYLVEAWVLCFLSLAVAFVWIELARVVFKSMTGVGLYGLYHWQTLAILVSITTLVGIAAGFYPSIILSNYNVIAALKGGNVKASGELLRKFLLVTQYAITAVLVSGIVVIQTQLNFVNNHDLGFDHHRVVVFGVHGSPEILAGYNAFANELKNNTAISGITRANTTMGSGVGNSLAHTQHADGKPLTTTVYRLRVDHDYLATYNIDLVAGRNFAESNPGDSINAFLVNEAMVREMGIEDAQLALGREVQTDGMKGKIIGVTRDFNYDGLHQKIEPMCIWLLSGGFSRVSIKIKGDVKENFATVMTAWKKHFPESPVQYRFLEDTLAGEYESDTRFSKVFLVFSGISLAIACLGLFALVSYNVERRAKEIGIRKVLGASINSIVSMVSKEFLILIGAGLVIALPVAYYFMDQWLMSFAYHVTLKMWMFAIAAVAVLLVAWITIGYRSVVAAAANPTDSLRSE